ncbi:MAG TPA: hypothetical protein VF185_01760 [Patescibacteria group bacterium]
MKGIVVGILVLIILAVAGFFVFKNLKTSGTPTTSNSPQVTIVGVLQSVPSTSEYSYIVIVNSQTIGVNSSKVDLKPFSGKKVQITGQYSGTTLYADQINEVP